MAGGTAALWQVDERGLIFDFLLYGKNRLGYDVPGGSQRDSRGPKRAPEASNFLLAQGPNHLIGKIINVFFSLRAPLHGV